MARVLLLAGTGAARRLAADLTSQNHDVLASLAGATAKPAPYSCPTRTGGFGGASGLAAWLRSENPDAVVDATHPFARQMTTNAIAAARATGVPLLRLSRPPWRPKPGEDWRDVPSVEAAVASLPRTARVFLATGRGSLGALAGTTATLFLRTVDPQPAPFPNKGEFVVARPPFDEASERALFERLGVTHLVVKNAGGAPGRTKLDAAAALRLPIFVVARPPDPPGAPRAMTSDEILSALAE